MEPKKEKIDDSIYCAPLVIFQRYKISILDIIHIHYDSFYCVYSQGGNAFGSVGIHFLWFFPLPMGACLSPKTFSQPASLFML
jgi:hypothetical protein